VRGALAVLLLLAVTGCQMRREGESSVATAPIDIPDGLFSDSIEAQADAPPPPEDTAGCRTYSTDIASIVAASCLGCHRAIEPRLDGDAMASRAGRDPGLARLRRTLLTATVRAA
jgi:hypothetical protein